MPTYGKIEVNIEYDNSTPPKLNIEYSARDTSLSALPGSGTTFSLTGTETDITNVQELFTKFFTPEEKQAYALLAEPYNKLKTGQATPSLGMFGFTSWEPIEEYITKTLPADKVTEFNKYAIKQFYEKLKLGGEEWGALNSRVFSKNLLDNYGFPNKGVTSNPDIASTMGYKSELLAEILKITTASSGKYTIKKRNNRPTGKDEEYDITSKTLLKELFNKEIYLNNRATTISRWVEFAVKNDLVTLQNSTTNWGAWQTLKGLGGGETHNVTKKNRKHKTYYTTEETI
jgi:hypothetical protein